MGFIEKKLIKDTSKEIDRWVNFPKSFWGNLAELLDGMAIQKTLGLLNNYADKIPERFRDEIILLLQAIAYREYQKISSATAQAIDEFVELPFAEKDFTAKWILLNVQMLQKFALYLARKNRIRS